MPGGCRCRSWCVQQRLDARAEAQDLAQDICAGLPVKLRHWRGEARFTTWLYRVVVNAAHDLRRRQAVRAKAGIGWGDWEIARQDEIAAQVEAQDWLEQAMSRLPIELRDTVALVLGEELTQAQAGAPRQGCGGSWLGERDQALLVAMPV